MKKCLRRFPLLRIILVHGVSFALALAPILLGGAFGRAESRLGVYPHAALLAEHLFSPAMFWNDLNAWGSISAPFGYEFQPLFLLLLSFLTPVTAVHALTLLYTVTAAVCATIFLRREGWAPQTSLFGGTVFAFVLWSWIFEPCISVVPPLLGITLLAFQSSRRRPFTSTIVATASFALLWLGSHVQFAVMAFLLSWIYLILLLLRGGSRKRIFAVGIVASLMGIVIGLVRLIPLIAHVALSSRASLGMMQTVDAHLLLFLFFPRLPLLFPGASLSYQVVPHMGAFVGACILLALTQIRRHRGLLALVALAVMPVFLSLPGVSTVALALPFVSLLGTPERWLTISMILLVPVACLGLDVLVSRTERSMASMIGWIFGGCGFVLLCAILFRSVSNGGFPSFIGSHFLFASLALLLTGMVFLLPRLRPPVTALAGIFITLLMLFGMMIEWRIPVAAVRGTPLFLPATAQEIVHVLAARSALPASLSPRAHALYDDTFINADTNLLYGVALTAVNDPTLSARTQAVLDLLGAEPPTSASYGTASSDKLSERLRSYDYLLPALGVQWVLSPVPLDDLTTLMLIERHSIEGEAMMYRYAVRQPRPLAYALPSVSLSKPSIDDLPVRLGGALRGRALVECDGCQGRDTSSGEGTFVVREENSMRIRIDVETPDDQWMAVQRIAQPGVKVSIDGRPVPYAIVHGLLIAVRVPRGSHTVTVSRSYANLLQDSLRILRGESCLWCRSMKSDNSIKSASWSAVIPSAV